MAQRTLYASAARTATPTAAVVNTARVKGLRLVIDVTASSATPSVVATIDGVDAASGKYFNLLTSAAITGAGTTVLSIAPGITVASNVSAAAILPDAVRITLTHGDADSITYVAAVHLNR